jgi:hypothetical protein
MVPSVTADDQVARLLHEAAELHHSVYRLTDGEDPDWASWYGDWLTRLSELPQLLGTEVTRSELVYLLVKLDKEHGAAEGWEAAYAREIVAALSAGGGGPEDPG